MSFLERIFRPVGNALEDWERPAKAVVIISFLVVYLTIVFGAKPSGYEVTGKLSAIFFLAFFFACSASPYIEIAIFSLIVAVEARVSSWGTRIAIILVAAGIVIFLTTMTAQHSKGRGGLFFAILFWLYSLCTGLVWTIALPQILFENGPELPDEASFSQFLSALEALFANRPTLFIALILCTLGAHLMLRRAAVYEAS